MSKLQKLQLIQAASHSLSVGNDFFRFDGVTYRVDADTKNITKILTNQGT